MRIREILDGDEDMGWTLRSNHFDDILGNYEALCPMMRMLERSLTTMLALGEWETIDAVLAGGDANVVALGKDAPGRPVLFHNKEHLGEILQNDHPDVVLAMRRRSMLSLPEMSLTTMPLGRMRPGRPGTFFTTRKTLVDRGEHGEHSDNGVQGEGQQSALAHDLASAYCSHSRVCKDTIF